MWKASRFQVLLGFYKIGAAQITGERGNNTFVSNSSGSDFSIFSWNMKETRPMVNETENRVSIFGLRYQNPPF